MRSRRASKGSRWKSSTSTRRRRAGTSSSTRRTATRWRHGHGASQRRRQRHDRDAVPGHQLRGAGVRPEIRGLDDREDLPDGRREPERESDLPERAVRVPRRTSRRSKSNCPNSCPRRLTTLQKACTARSSRQTRPRAPRRRGSATRRSHAVGPGPVEGPGVLRLPRRRSVPELISCCRATASRSTSSGRPFISKAGVTTTTFKTVPDEPFSSFELTLPKGPYSALTAAGNLCMRRSSRCRPNSSRRTARRSTRPPRSPSPAARRQKSRRPRTRRRSTSQGQAGSAKHGKR